MKILCEYTPCGPSYVRTGWGRVFQVLGHDFRFWVPERKSAFDAFSEYDPDLFIGCTYDVDRATAKCIAARPKMRVALFASAWGDLVKDIDREKYPIVIASDEEKTLIERLKGDTGRPDFVFIHVSDKYLEGTMGGWRTIGVKPVGILNAADTFVYLDGMWKPELACDVAFVGGYWGYKARNLDRYILPLCHPSHGLKTKLFGNSPWPVAQYLGHIEDQEVKDLFASSTICPNVSEPHSTDLGWDTIERPFKVLASGGFCVSDYVEEMVDIFGDCIPFVHSTQGMLKMVKHFVQKPDDRLPLMEKGRRLVLTEHTYFERVAQIFEELGMNKEVSKMLQAKGEHLKGKP